MPPNQIMQDEVFGPLMHVAGDLWQRTVLVRFRGEASSVPISIRIRKKDGIEQNQIAAYKAFVENQQSFLQTAELAISDLLHDKPSATVKLEGIYFPYARPKPTIGILFQSNIDEEHGLAVKFEDSHLTEIGPQDIVL